jgi:hypothetical protein
MDSDTGGSSRERYEGSLFLGLIVCWLLNLAHLGVAYLVFVSNDRALTAVFVLVGAIGLLQAGYVAPIWYVLRRRGKKSVATGLAIAAGTTLLLNSTFWLQLLINV